MTWQTARSKTLVGRSVLSAQDGQELGAVTDVLFEPATRNLLGVVFRGTDGAEAGLRFADIQALGPDAVLLKEGAVPLPVEDLLAVTGTRAKDDPLYGLKVVSDRGSALGQIEDLLFDAMTGKLTGLEISDGLIQDFVAGRVSIPVPEQLTVGHDVLIVPGEVEERVRTAKGKPKRSD